MGLGAFNPQSAVSRLPQANIASLLQGASSSLNNGISGLSDAITPFQDRLRADEAQTRILERDKVKRDNRLVDELNTFERGVEVKNAKNEGISELMAQFNGATDKKQRQAIKTEIIARGGSASLINGLGDKTKNIHKTFVDKDGKLTAVYSDGTSGVIEGNYSGTGKQTKSAKFGGYTGPAQKFYKRAGIQGQGVLDYFNDGSHNIQFKPSMDKEGKEVGNGAGTMTLDGKQVSIRKLQQLMEVDKIRKMDSQIRNTETLIGDKFDIGISSGVNALNAP